MKIGIELKSDELTIHTPGMSIMTKLRQMLPALLAITTKPAHANDAMYDGVLPVPARVKGRYVDMIPMNTVDDTCVHNDECPHGTLPTHYDFIVRQEELSEEAIDCEMDDVPPEYAEFVNKVLHIAFNIQL